MMADNESRKFRGERAVVLLSGGQDSGTCLAWAVNRFDGVEAISYLYGQLHSIEVEYARKLAKRFGAPHLVVDISFFKSVVDSALVGMHGLEVEHPHPRLKDLPGSFVPNRNGLLLLIAHAYAQKLGIKYIVAGMCQTDFSGYPDCRDAFVKSFTSALNMGSSANITVLTPLMYLTKAETWELAEKEGALDVVRFQTMTCYHGDTSMNDWGMGCGKCPACILRAKGWNEYKSNKFRKAERSADT